MPKAQKKRSKDQSVKISGKSASCDSVSKPSFEVDLPASDSDDDGLLFDNDMYDQAEASPRASSNFVMDEKFTYRAKSERPMGNYKKRGWTRSCLTIRGRPCPLFPIAAVCGLGTFWTLLFTILQRYDVDPQDYGIPPVAVSVLGGTVGFLIVYRTGESAKRWWDGRTHFGSAVAFSVDLVRNSTTAIISNKQLANCIALYALAVVVCLKNQLLMKPKKDAVELRQFLPQDAVDRIIGSKRLTEEEELVYMQELNDGDIKTGARPLLILQMLDSAVRAGVRAGHMSEIKAQSMDESLQLITLAYYGCVKIKTTPLPFSYNLHLKTLLMVYLAMLPLAMIYDAVDPYMSVITMFLISFCLLGLEQLGEELEDPFGRDRSDLPLQKLTESCAYEIQSLLSGAVEQSQYFDRIATSSKPPAAEAPV